MTSSNALFTTPFDCNTDFIDLADNCQRYCEALVEETNPARKIALCGRLASTFALLRPMLLEPIPEHLQGRRLESRCWVEVVFSLSLWERAGVRASYRTCFIFINRTLIMNNQKNYASQRRHAHYLRPKGASLSAHCPGVLPVHALKTSMNALTLL